MVAAAAVAAAEEEDIVVKLADTDWMSLVVDWLVCVMDCAVEAADFHVVVELAAVEVEGLAVDHSFRTALDNYCIQLEVDTQMVVVDSMVVVVVVDMTAVVGYDVAAAGKLVRLCYFVDMQHGKDFVEAAIVVDCIDVEVVVLVAYLAVVVWLIVEAEDCRVAHFHQVCDNCWVVERVAVAHSSGRMAVEMDTIQVGEHSALEVLDTVDNLRQLTLILERGSKLAQSFSAKLSKDTNPL